MSLKDTIKKKYLTEAEQQMLPNKGRKTKILLFGRMNPPTAGHEQHIMTAKELAKKHGGHLEIVLSHSKGDENNPLDPETKLGHLRSAFPFTKFTLATDEHPTIMHHVKKAHADGYKHLIVLGGGDRAKHFEDIIKKYNGMPGHYKFDSISVKSSGDRIAGMSGTDMRNHVKNGDFDKFRKGLPTAIRSDEKRARELFDQVKAGLDATKRPKKSKAGQSVSGKSQGNTNGSGSKKASQT